MTTARDFARHAKDNEFGHIDPARVTPTSQYNVTGVQPAKAPTIWIIYGKHKDSKRFAPMDLSEGRTVVNLIYATMLNDEQKDRFMANEAPRNHDWTFEARDRT